MKIASFKTRKEARTRLKAFRLRGEAAQSRREGIHSLLAVVLAMFLVVKSSLPSYALSGHADISSAWNDYVWLYTDHGAVRWTSNTFGQSVYSGLDSINGIAFNVSLDTLAQYGTYVNGTINFTLQGNGYWANGDLSNVACEVWTNGGGSRISSTMGISTSYYKVSDNPERYAVDYRCSLETSSGQSPAYAYIRVGTNRNNDSTIVPIMNGYNITGHLPSPVIRNVSFDYNTSNEGLENANLSQIEQNTSSLINGQKEIYNNISEQGDRVVNSIDNLNVSIENSEDGAQARWEQDKQEQADKQDELESQSDDLAVSAQNPGNPFASMFNSSGCQSLPTVSSWFNMSEPMQVCSPYPQNIRPIIEFVSSAIVVGLLLRVYFKQLNGGYDS